MLQTLHLEDNFIISYTCSSTVLARAAVHTATSQPAAEDQGSLRGRALRHQLTYPVPFLLKVIGGYVIALAVRE